jgi:hypothetical protein
VSAIEIADSEPSAVDQSEPAADAEPVFEIASSAAPAPQAEITPPAADAPEGLQSAVPAGGEGHQHSVTDHIPEPAQEYHDPVPGHEEPGDPVTGPAEGSHPEVHGGVALEASAAGAGEHVQPDAPDVAVPPAPVPPSFESPEPPVEAAQEPAPIAATEAIEAPDAAHEADAAATEPHAEGGNPAEMPEDHAPAPESDSNEPDDTDHSESEVRETAEPDSGTETANSANGTGEVDLEDEFWNPPDKEEGGRGSFYSRRSGRLPRLGADASRGAMSAALGMRIGRDEDD